MKTGSKKLVLFDIDGTLIRTVAASEAIKRFPYSIEQAFGKTVSSSVDLWKTFNGWTDRNILWAHVEPTGISKEAFLSKLGVLEDAFIAFLDRAADKQQLYAAIHDATILFEQIHLAEHLVLGTLTGNLKKSAHWKLKHAGIDHTKFELGIYGNEADLRDDLARLVIPRAQQELGFSPDPTQIIVIGDTVHDIRCARAIGATVIAVSTGWNIPKETLEHEHPDLLVDTLLDGQVLTLLGLTHIV